MKNLFIICMFFVPSFFYLHGMDRYSTSSESLLQRRCVVCKKKASDEWNAWWEQVSWDEEEAKKPEKIVEKITDMTCWTLFKKVCKRVVDDLRLSASFKN